MSGYSGFCGLSGYSGYSGPGPMLKATVAAATFTTSSTSLVTITGLSLALTVGTWAFEININGNKATGTAGAIFGVQFSGTATSIACTQVGQLANNTWGATAKITALHTASTTLMTTSAAQCNVRIAGHIVVTVAGNLTAEGGVITSQTLTVDAGSSIEAFKVA